MSKIRNKLKHGTRTVAIPTDSVSITAESDALAAATVANWLNVQSWRAEHPRSGLSITDQSYFDSFTQFEIDIEADAAETITAVKLYACRLAPVTIAADTFASSGADAINTATAHGMLTGDGPFQLTTTDTLPAGLELLTDYYVENTGANTFELYLTRDLAVAAGGGIATTDAGTGTHTITTVTTAANPDDNVRRFRFALVGDLNSAAAVVLGPQVSYMERINHSPLDLYYTLVATVGSVQTVTVRLTPVMAIEE